MKNHRCHIAFLSVCGAVAAAAGMAHAATINVPADQPTIQAAIDAAVNGDEVVVAPGTYNEQLNFGGKAITVRSSAGAAVTTISNPVGPLVTFATGETSASVLDGFTLTGVTSTAADGGALSLIFASPTLRNLVISGNTLTGNPGAGAYIQGGAASFSNSTFINNTSVEQDGSAVFAFSTTDLSFNNVIFNNNEDTSGMGFSGAVLLNECVSTFSNCTFTGNDANGGAVGGGIYAFEGSLTVAGGTFSANSTLDGGLGAAIYTFGTNVTITGASFSTNLVGGAVYLTDSNSVVRSSSFTSNVIDGGSGGGLSFDGGTILVEDCTFTDNFAIGGSGGALGFGRSGTFTLRDSTFTSNEAPGGTAAAVDVEGIIISSISGTIDRCVFIENGLVDDPANGGSGGALRVGRNATVTVANSLFTGNTGGSGSFQLTNNANATVVNCTFVDNVPGAGHRTFQLNTPSVLRVQNSIVRGSTASNRRMFPASLPAVVLTVVNSNVSGGYAGTGNINADPLFADPASGDFRLTPGSPSVDAGNSLLLPVFATLDLDSGDRIAGAAVDQGAYELVVVSACDSVDFNNDGVFPDDQDLADFIFVLGGGTCATCNDVDFNNDGVFPDDSDLAVFLFVLGGGSC